MLKSPRYRTSATETQPSSLQYQGEWSVSLSPCCEKYYVTVTYGAIARQTQSVQREGSHVEQKRRRFVRKSLIFLFQLTATSPAVPYNHTLISLSGSQAISCLSQEIACEPHRGSSLLCNSCVWLNTLHVELDIIFGSADGHPRQPATVLKITGPSLTATVNPRIPQWIILSLKEAQHLKPCSPRQFPPLHLLYPGTMIFPLRVVLLNDQQQGARRRSHVPLSIVLRKRYYRYDKDMEKCY